jgi:nitrogen fixation/metabolism regulation signal transduction histidine kinase
MVDNSCRMYYIWYMTRVLVGTGLFLGIVLAGSAIPAIDLLAQANTHAQADGIMARLSQMWALLVVIPIAGAAIFGWAALTLRRR